MTALLELTGAFPRVLTPSVGLSDGILVGSWTLPYNLVSEDPISFEQQQQKRLHELKKLLMKIKQSINSKYFISFNLVCYSSYQEQMVEWLVVAHSVNSHYHYVTWSVASILFISFLLLLWTFFFHVCHKSLKLFYAFFHLLLKFILIWKVIMILWCVNWLMKC